MANEAVVPLSVSSAVLRQLEINYADNIAGGENRMVRSLCYDMGHVFGDEEEFSNCIADMRAIGEGCVTEVRNTHYYAAIVLSVTCKCVLSMPSSSGGIKMQGISSCVRLPYL